MGWGEGRRGRCGGAYHDCHVFIVDAVVVHGWLEEVGVLLEPGGVSCALLICVCCDMEAVLCFVLPIWPG